MAIVTDRSTKELKQRLKSALYGTDLSVQSCSSLDDGTRASWGAFYISAMDYVNEDSSFWLAASDMNRGEAYEQELYDWQKKIEGKGCELKVPKTDPSASRSSTDNLIKWAGVAVVAVSSAYVIGKIATVVIEAERIGSK